MEKVSVFSPHQIYIGTFLGGPLAGIYFIWKNFTLMANSNGAKFALAIGTVCVIAITLLIYILPNNFPHMLVPMLYSILPMAIAWQFQVSKEEEAVSEKYGFVSNWRVASVSLIAIISYLLILAIIFLTLQLFGIKILA